MRKFSYRAALMPHEITSLDISPLMDSCDNINSNTDRNLVAGKNTGKSGMVSKIKDAAIVETGPVKVPIPEHIYDANSKTFYKLGEFLGKVIIIWFEFK